MAPGQTTPAVQIFDCFGTLMQALPAPPVSLSAAVILAPAAAGRNRIIPTLATVSPLELRQATAQSAPMLPMYDSAGLPITAFDQFGQLNIQGDSRSISGTPLRVRDTSTGVLFAIFNTGNGSICHINSFNDTDVTLQVFPNGSGTQSVDMFQVMDTNSFNPLFAIDKNVVPYLAQNPSPFGAPFTPVRVSDWIPSLVNMARATYTGRAVFNVWDHTAAREALRLESDGTQALLGIGGAVTLTTLLTIHGNTLIQPLADLPSLMLRPFLDAQTNPILQVQDAAGGTDWLRVQPSGNLTCPGGGGVGSERFGDLATANGPSSTSIGYSASADGSLATSLGTVSNASGGSGTAIGYDSSAIGLDGATSIGRSAAANGTGAAALGAYSTVTNDAATGVGTNTTVPNRSIGIGAGATTTADGQLVIGSDVLYLGGPPGCPISQVYIGNGVTEAVPLAVTIQPTGGNGANITGANITLAGGQSTGSAKGGDTLIQISPSGGAGSGLNALITMAQFTGDRKIGFFSVPPVVQQANASAAGIAGIAAGALYAQADMVAVKAALTAISAGLAANGILAATA